MIADNKDLQTILNSLPIGIVHFGLNRKVKFCNPALWRMYGLDQDELLGQSLPLPEDRRAEWTALEDQLRNGTSFLNIRTVRRRKDGSMFTAYISGVPLFDERNELAGLLGLIIESYADGLDSTQVAIEDLMALADTSSDFLMLIDPDLQILYANEGLATIAGRDLREVLGTRILDYFVPEQRSEAEAYLKNLLQSGASTEHYPELRMTNHLMRTEIPVRFKLYPIYRSGARTLVSIACVGKDLEFETDLRQKLHLSEQESDTLFESMPFGVVKVGTNGIPIASNKRFQEMMGYSADEVVRIPFATFVHPEDLKTGRELFLKLAEGKIDRYETHKRLIVKRGSVIQTKMTVTLMRDASGRPDHTISMVEQVVSQTEGITAEEVPCTIA